MSDDAPAAPSDAAPRRRWKRLFVWTSAALAVVLVAGVGTAYAYYRVLRGNMVQHDLSSALDEEERPPKIGEDINILFIGSDGREGGNSAYGGRDFVGERSDSLMLAHISPDNGVTMVNFPRDSLVQLPECQPYEGTEGTYGYYGMINAALYHGGPPCAVKTIETLTDIRIDHFVHLSFVGFRDMVDAIGGVEMCIPEPMRDERSKLDLEAGQQVLDGEQALAFVRARYEIGDGGDIGRIDRQQMFLGALAEQVTSSDVLTSPSRTTSLLQAVSEHTATDQDLSLDQMISIGSTLADVDLHDITFYTVPWWPAPLDPNRVVWDEERAAELFQAINNDRRLDDAALETGAPSAPGASPSPSAQPSPSYPAEPSTEPVDAAADQAEAIEGRDATSNPCVNGLGEGTEEE
ncbi:LCP family protein [Marinitenerispora sediminis]|uniref:Transcriptional regulator n=1 Tax=Marinitenerispora sediminis TaxID=1931232 RepID=A0A368T1Q3_9ACTN|nr:LCP family protein [Marinitenerispora sediminis]RCV48966.1 transcriptional regulator [Marinitenerispora sediminis]RCV57792.1 transcriptional regulator [Marinitenerispora sediminis]RCV59537.1 transcriptional regulator [Marinitenerispora sediminis]